MIKNKKTQIHYNKLYEFLTTGGNTKTHTNKKSLFNIKGQLKNKEIVFLRTTYLLELSQKLVILNDK